MPVTLWTGRRWTSDPRAIDISRQGCHDLANAGKPSPGVTWAPSWDLLAEGKTAWRRAESLAKEAAGLAFHDDRRLALFAEAERIAEEAWSAYGPAFTAELRVSAGMPVAKWGDLERLAASRGVKADRPAWRAMLTGDFGAEVAITCWCREAARCHRSLALSALVAMGARVGQPERVAFTGSRPPREPVSPSTAKLWTRMLGHVRKVVDVELLDGTVVVHGGAAGIDATSHAAALARGLPTEIHRPDREAHPTIGAALLARNAYVETCLRVYAYPAPWSGGGTWDAIRKARAAGIEPWVYPGDERASAGDGPLFGRREG